MERGGNVTHARPFVRLPPPPAHQDAAAEPPPSIRVGSRDLKAWTACVAAAAGGVPSERGRIATTTQLEWWVKLPKAVTAKHAGQGRESNNRLPPPPPLRSPPTRHRVRCHYYGDDGGTKRRGRVVPSLPQHGRRSGLVEEEWASRRDPPPTSPPTVIVAVIGINQRAHLATTTATTEAPNAVVSRGRGVEQPAAFIVYWKSLDLGETGRDRNNNQRLGCCYYYPSHQSSPPLPNGCRRHKARTSRRAQSEQCGNNQQYPSSAPLLEAGNTNEEDPLLAKERAKQNGADDQTDNRWWGLSRTSQRPPQTQG
ncbi:hypothetical protein O3P69_012019 [Scylla paramamosain]|uniref:Uncharacterized protein n=1 Tax=Scylla paramamosain TaxID=85552 RepID=A0AAW0SFX7_SCYPA